MKAATPFQVLIIGSGATGLSFAHSLRKAGISYRIFEKHTPESLAKRTRDWGLTLHWGASLLPAIYEQDLIDNLVNAQTNQNFDYRGDEEVVIRNSQTGEFLKSIPLESARRLSRGKLVNVLKKGIDIEYGKELINITFTDDGVVAHFQDGTQVEGSTLIAADGANSPVRKFLVGEEASRLLPLDIVSNNIAVRYPPEQAVALRGKMTRFLDMGIHPEGTFSALVALDIPDESDPSSWIFQVFVTFPGSLAEEDKTPEGRARVLKARMKEYADPFKSAIEWLPEGQYIPNDSLAYWPICPWDNHGGRVTIVGDAAHPFTPHRGQGLNNCLQDLHNLTEALKNVKAGNASLVDAITAFDEEMRTRGQAEMNMSVKQTMLMHKWDALMSSPLMTIGAARPEAKKSS